MSEITAKKRRLRATLLMVLGLVIVALLFFSISPDEEITSKVTGTPTPSAGPVAEIPTVTYTTKGFVPAVITTKSGELFRIANGTSTTIQIESGPHPTHTSNSELNAGSISGGGNRTVTLSRTGTFEIHNEFNLVPRATVTVQ